MGTSKVSKKSSKRERTKYTPEQIDILERVFANTHYPDSSVMDDIADQLEIPSDKVSIWFQNRRSKFKKESRDSQVSWMRKQVYNQENIPRLLTLPSVHESKRPDTQKKSHVLSTAQLTDKSCTENKRPSSNLHYKPSPNVLTISPIRWEPNLRYTTPSPTYNMSSSASATPSPPYNMSSCASDILRDSNINPTTVRPDHPTEIQMSGQISPPNFWPSCMMTPSNTHVPIPAPTILPQYSLFPAMDLTNHQFNLL